MTSTFQERILIIFYNFSLENMNSDFPVDVIPEIQSFLGGEDFTSSRFVSSSFTQSHQLLHSIVYYNSSKPLPKYITKVKLGPLVDDSVLENASQLVYLGFNGNQNMTDKCLLNKPNLRNLGINRCLKITDNAFKQLKLTLLSAIFCTQLTDKTLSYLGSVKEFAISGNEKITNNGLRWLIGIEFLLVDACKQITDEGMYHLRNIKVLSISGCTNVTDKGFNFLREIVGLNASFTQITDGGLAGLIGIKNLLIDKCQGVTEAGLSKLKSLETLSMSFCRNVNSDLFQYLPTLDHLNISNCKLIKEKDFAFLTNLKQLSMNNIQVSDNVFQFLSKVGTLNMNGCKFISDRGIRNLDNCTNLNISDCNQVAITDQAFRHLKLDTLIMKNCNQKTITPRLFDFIEGIRVLDIRGCTQFTRDDLIDFKAERLVMDE